MLAAKPVVPQSTDCSSQRGLLCVEHVVRSITLVLLCVQERLKALLEERKKLVEGGAEPGHSHARSASNGEQACA
jgi:hypothetical protein